jgi:hypothetical protein
MTDKLEAIARRIRQADDASEDWLEPEELAAVLIPFLAKHGSAE